MDKIDVQAEETAKGLIVRIKGQASVEEIEELDRQLRMMTALSPKLVVLDLSAVPYISSMGIGSLLRFRNEIAEAGGRVTIAGAQKSVADILKLAKIDRVLPLYESVDAAMKS